MVDQSLQQLYKAQPLAKVAVQHAAGYAVFSDWGVKILFAGSGNGTGLAVNNKTHQKTYMKMIEAQAGLGFGVSKFRNIFVFESQEALQKFINSGWEFGGQATAAAKTTTKGGAMSGAAPGCRWSVALSVDGGRPEPLGNSYRRQVLQGRQAELSVSLAFVSKPGFAIRNGDGSAPPWPNEG
jgi:hypothetical protein